MEDKNRKYLTKFGLGAYGLGTFGLAFMNIVASYALLFMTDYVGMSPGIVAALIAVSKIIDAFTDVVAGSIIDKTRSSFGSARIWMLRSAPLVAISAVAFFMIPEVSSDVLKYVYFFVTYNLFASVAYTMYTIANSSMQLFMTKNEKERVSLSVFNFLFTTLGSIAVTSSYLGMISRFGGGLHGWRMLSVVYSAIYLVLSLIYIFSVRELEREDNRDDKQDGRKDTLKNIGYLLKNRYFIGQFLIMFFYTGGTVVFSMAIPFYCIRVLGDVNNAAGTQTVLSLSASGVIIGVILTSLFTNKLGLYKSNLITRILSCVGYIPVIIGSFTGSFTLIAVGELLCFIMQGPYLGTVALMNGKICEYTKQKNGVDLEATMTSCVSVGSKLGNAIGAAIVGWLLNAAHYDGLLEVQPQSAINMIISLFVLVPFIIQIIIGVILAGMDVDKGLAGDAR